MFKGIVFCLVLVLLSTIVCAVECPPGFSWRRMSGVGCVQSDCNDIPHAHWSYTSACICASMDNIDDPDEDMYSKMCTEPVDYEGFDREKCSRFCPGSKVISCILPTEKCPDEVKEEFNEAVSEAGAPQLQVEVPSQQEKTKQICDTHCKNQWGDHAVWDGESEVDYCWCSCENGYHQVVSKMRDSRYGIDTRAHCIAEGCETHCDDLGEAYTYETGSSTKKRDCVCRCSDGFTENYPWGFCVAIDDTFVYLEEGRRDCDETSQINSMPVIGDICSCKQGLANCDRNNHNGCETDTARDRLNCGACGRHCPATRICYNGFCWDKVFGEAFTMVEGEDPNDVEKIEELRGNRSYIERFPDLDEKILWNHFQHLWGQAGNAFNSKSIPGKFFDVVSKYWSYIGKPQSHLELRDDINNLLAEGKIDSQQAEMIKNFDALLKTASVLSGKDGGRSALYPQGALIDTATDVVVAEAIRSAQYGYCRDILIKYGANPTDPIQKQTVDRCLKRQVSAGIFK
ncbi:MAG: hypothetical protein GF334_07415 [Candidatus Altiarchaeales archaeon]|nr:hypothetical protein [Candidatus Altiarchaeales archaeon]